MDGDKGGLVLSRLAGQAVVILDAEGVELVRVVLDCTKGPGKARLRFLASRRLQILREELLESRSKEG
jgi:hypothetical protein